MARRALDKGKELDYVVLLSWSRCATTGEAFNIPGSQYPHPQSKEYKTTDVNVLIFLNPISLLNMVAYVGHKKGYFVYQ